MSFPLRICFTVVWIFCIVYVEGFCYPDEDLAECQKRRMKSEEPPVSVWKEISAHRQPCRVSGSSRYLGTCQYRSDCTKRSYGYSSICGLGGLVCRKGRPVSREKYTTTKQPRKTTRPSRAPVRTTRRPSSVDAFKNEQCGVPGPSTTIFGGVKAEEGELQFMVSFVTRWGTSFCGGVLITRKHDNHLIWALFQLTFLKYSGDSDGPLLYLEKWTAYRWTVYRSKRIFRPMPIVE